MHLFTLRNLFEEASCLKHLWESKALCDVVLKSKDGGCVWAHRIVLASVSSFFRAMFTGTGRSMREVEERLPTGEQCIELRGVTGDALEMVMRAIYAKDLEVLIHMRLKSLFLILGKQWRFTINISCGTHQIFRNCSHQFALFSLLFVGAL